MADVKLNDFERRVWGEIEQSQINKYYLQSHEITNMKEELG